MSGAIEARVKALEEQNKVLQKQVQALQDIEDIQNLEMAYGYFLEHLMVDEVADCWADNGVLEWLGLGRFKGKETIRKLWGSVKEHFLQRGGYLHMGPRFCPYITISPNGKTANGRWYVAGGQMGASMLCENTYVKDNGVWKFNVLSVGGFPRDLFGDAASTSAQGPDAAGTSTGPGGAGPGKMTPEQEERQTQEYMNFYKFTERISRCPRQEDAIYLRPFSFKHPVTGKDVNKTVEAWNKAHPCTMPPGGEKWTAFK
jgi:hypothetical protein